jgi:mono/diheme cytochrome c family protein
MRFPSLRHALLANEVVVSNLRVIFTSLAALVAVGAVTVLASPLRTTRDGVFTTEQAARGKAVYEKSCATCHPKEFYVDRLARWENSPVADLFESVSASMPQDNPGSLLTREYLDALAYIFSITGSPAGNSELTTESIESINVGSVQ